MKKRLNRIAISAILFIIALIVSSGFKWIKTGLFFISYIIVGGDILKRAVRNITKGKVFDENFLMSIATIGAFLIGEYPEGVAVMLFYQLGELFQSYAVDRSRRSIASLMDIRPDYANVKKGDKIIKVDPEEVKIGDILIIKAGEKIPLDGMILEGSTMVDTSALTGESIPRDIGIGDEVLSGCININGLITIEVSKEYEESTVSKILDLVENASTKKAKSERFITRFASYYTPVVVIAAVLLAIFPPLLVNGEGLREWIYRALAFLVVSCPCAFVLSVPLSFFGGIGGASKQGILVKGANYLEALAQTEIVVFDKTGTLTKGVFRVQEVHPEKGFSNDDLLELAAYAENYSSHPISQSLKQAYGGDIDNTRISENQEIPGHGIIASIDGKKVIVGNDKLMERENIEFTKVQITGTMVHLAVDNQYAGYIIIADEIKEDSAKAIKRLKQAKVKKTVMLTGDKKNIGEKVAAGLALDKVYTELLPADKVEKLEELFTHISPKGKLAYVGDGINDAPVLARADIGIAMGALGSDAAVEAADVVIMTDEPSKIATAISISNKTLMIVYQNIIFAIGIKLIVLVLSALGITSMWTAIFADVGVTILAVLNAFRAYF
jgi:Cd2+/Zn2+-exporting ATPase